MPARRCIAPGFSNFQMVDVRVPTFRTPCWAPREALQCENPPPVLGNSAELFHGGFPLCFFFSAVAAFGTGSLFLSSVASLTVFWLCFPDFLGRVSQSSDVAVISHGLMPTTSCESWKSP